MLHAHKIAKNITKQTKYIIPLIEVSSETKYCWNIEIESKIWLIPANTLLIMA